MIQKKVYWKMRNGNMINVDDMEINHLRNVLKMIIKNRKKESFILVGDMANVFNETYFAEEDEIE